MQPSLTTHGPHKRQQDLTYLPTHSQIFQMENITLMLGLILIIPLMFLELLLQTAKILMNGKVIKQVPRYGISIAMLMEAMESRM